MESKQPHSLRFQVVRCLLVSALVLGAFVTVTPASASGSDVEVWFTRHANDATNQVSLGGGMFANDCINVGLPNECCIEILNPLGVERAAKYVDYFRKKGITQRLTHVFASHKGRTLATVRAVAADAGLTNDFDLTPDGVQQLPANALECAAGFESSGVSRVPTENALLALPPGSVALVGAHSGTIYRILEDFGVDTSDPVDFPRSSNGQVEGYTGLWKIIIKSNGTVVYKKHLSVEFFLKANPDE